jgi:hypothetical protein
MLEDNPQSKGEILLKQFSNYGYKPTNKISKSELILFFERKLRNAQFNEDLKNIFAYLNINDTTTLTIEQFISGVLQLENEIRSNYEMCKSQYLEQENIYNNLSQQCQKYGAEKYNEEGFGESANLHGEIINMQFKKYMQGCQTVIITLEYAGQKKELKPKYSPNGNVIINEPIEFKAKSKKDTIEIHVQGDTGYGYIYELGSKSYTLPELKTQEDFTDKITIPEFSAYGQDPKAAKTLAELNVKLGMIWSYYDIYELQRQNEEPKLNQLRINLQNAEENLNKFNQIYGENIITSTMLMERRNEITSAKKLNENSNVFEDKSNKKKKFEFPGKNFEVEFNYMRMDKQKTNGLKVDFNDDIKLSNIKKLTTNSKNLDLDNSQIKSNLQLLNEHNLNIPQSPNLEQNEMNLRQSRNLEQNSNMNFEQNQNMEQNQNLEQNRSMEHSQNLEQNRSMEHSQNLEQNQNMEQNPNLLQNQNMEHSQNLEQNQNMEYSQNLEQNQNMEQNPNLLQNNMNFEPNQNLEKSQSQNPEENENLKKSNSDIFEENQNLEKSEVLEEPLQKEENLQPNFGQDIKDTGGIPQDDNEEESNENANRNAELAQNLNISHHSNMSKGSNLMQNLNMLKQSNVSYNYNLTRNSNEIRNSRNMLQNSNIQQSNMAQNPNAMNNSNMLQRSMQQNSQIMQNQDIQQSNAMNNSNMLQRSMHQNSQVMQNQNIQRSNISQRSNAMNNSNILQRSNISQRSNDINNSNIQQSKTLQNPNVMQNSNIQQSNMPQQSNVMNNSNMLLRSNISQRSKALNNSNMQQNSMLQKSKTMQNPNMVQGSNLMQNSNISHHSNLMQNSNMIRNSQQSNASNKDLKNVDFNQAQSFATIKQPIINKSMSKEIIQENTLPSQYLPEKVNQAIVENSVTLPLVETKKNITYSTKQNYNYNNLLGMSHSNQVNPTMLSYQGQVFTNQNL